MNTLETQPKEYATSLTDIVEQLNTDDWQSRLDASLDLETLADEAGEIVGLLHQIASTNNAPARHIATWLIRIIGKKTTARWKAQASDLLCPHCIVYCYRHTVRLSKSSVAFYGCRHCRQSREFIDVVNKKVVAILDNETGERCIEQSDTLLVNWLTDRSLVDFDKVRIIRATDEDVERFAVQIGNDTDPVRRPAYKEIDCEIMASCNLSENTLRILQKTFRRVKKISHR